MKHRVSSTLGQVQLTGQPSQPPSKHKTGEGKADKLDKQQKRPQTPFHHRSLTSDDTSIETETTAGQRLTTRTPDGGRFTGIQSADMTSIQKAPHLRSEVVSSGPSEQTNSPQPPPLSPHPCERNESGEVMKNPSSPNSQHFFQPTPEPCLVGVKAVGSSEEHGGAESLNKHFHSHHLNPGRSSFSEPPEPTVYVDTEVNLEDDSLNMPWRLFKLPHRKEADQPTPQLPGDKLRDEASEFHDNVLSATE